VLASALATTATAVLPRIARAGGETILNDASHLNPTPVARHIVVRPGQEAVTLQLLRNELKDAAAAGRAVAIGAARHSMGGQSLARSGTAFTFDTPVWRRQGVELAVPDLTKTIQELNAQGAILEHLYDY
jgi:hypothetical protein